MTCPNRTSGLDGNASEDTRLDFEAVVQHQLGQQVLLPRVLQYLCAAEGRQERLVTDWPHH